MSHDNKSHVELERSHIHFSLAWMPITYIRYTLSSVVSHFTQDNKAKSSFNVFGNLCENFQPCYSFRSRMQLLSAKKPGKKKTSCLRWPTFFKSKEVFIVHFGTKCQSFATMVQHITIHQHGTRDDIQSKYMTG